MKIVSLQRSMNRYSNVNQNKRPAQYQNYELRGTGLGQFQDINIPSFLGRIPRELECISNLKEVPCPCCGKLKIIKSEYKKFKWPHHNEPLQTSDILGELKDNIKDLMSDERAVFNRLSKLNKEQPNSSYDTLLANITNPPSLFVDYLSRQKSLSEEEYNKKVFEILNQFKIYMRPTEKKAFLRVEEVHKQNPTLSVNKIIKSLRPKYVKKLQKEQYAMFDNISSVIVNLPDVEAQKIRELINISKKIITADSSDDPFRRKAFIAQIHSTIDPLPKSDIKFEVLKAVNMLPNSSTSLSAFIVKYSGYTWVFNEKTNQFELKNRTSRGIAEAFINKSKNSLEHVIAKSTIRSVKQKNNPSHLTFECAGCNNARGHTPLDEVVMLNPQMPKNTQKTFDSLIKISNSGKYGIVGYEWYIKDLAHTFEQESKGLIKVDISKLKQKTPPLDLIALMNHFKGD